MCVGINRQFTHIKKIVGRKNKAVYASMVQQLWTEKFPLKNSCMDHSCPFTVLCISIAVQKIPTSWNGFTHASEANFTSLVILKYNNKITLQIL